MDLLLQYIMRAKSVARKLHQPPLPNFKLQTSDNGDNVKVEESTEFQGESGFLN